MALVFVAVLGTFVAAEVTTHRTAARIDALSDSIVEETTPSIVRLAALREAVLNVNLALAQFLRAPPPKRDAAEAGVRSSLHVLAESVAGYLALPVADGEPTHWRDVQRSWATFDASVRRALAEPPSAEASLQTTGVLPAGIVLLDSAMAAIEFNAKYGRTLAFDIKHTKQRAIALANGLTGLIVVLAVVGGLLIHRDARAKRSMFDSYAQFLEERSAELEQFAGRVAHDIRNPVSAESLGATLLVRGVDREDLRETARRILRGLARTDAIIEGLLDFARAGARPDPGARVDVRDVVRDVVSGILPSAEEARIDLHVAEPVPTAFVACSTGVYLSLASNLIRNAIKYMGDSSRREITVKICEMETRIRTEVTDTGPGLAASALPMLFEPYFRGPSREKSGLGLGLATVKKLAERHGGASGATSQLGVGSTFWFELPRAGSPGNVEDVGFANTFADSTHLH